MTESTQPEIPAQRRWDPLVRIVHWGIVIGVIANGFLTDDGSLTHLLFGWSVLALLVIRLIWGFIGPCDARFSAFPPDLRGAVSYMTDLFRHRARPTLSHNPAGALMAYALWVCLAVVTATGIGMTGIDGPIMAWRDKAAVASGDWQALVREDRHGAYHEQGDTLSDILEEVHEVAANTVLLLALLHVIGIVIEGRTRGRNVVQSMAFGRKKSDRQP